MKITKQKLKQLIEEELGALGQPAPAPIQSTWPGSTEALMALAPVAEALAADLGGDEFEIAKSLANVIIKEFYQGV